jgi:hypothetical protein
LAKPRKSGRTAASAARQASGQAGQLLKLIDQKDTIKRYAELLEKVSRGTLDTPGFIKQISMDAALRVAHIMHTSPDEKVQLSAATEILDRAGVGRTTKVQVGGGLTVDHDTSKMELINLILSSAAKHGLKVKAESGPLLQARQVGAVDMEPGDFVDAVVEEVKSSEFEATDPEVLKERAG